jgi:hypothetical protein
MEQAYLTLWKQYLTELSQGADNVAQSQGSKLVEWARTYVKTHKLKQHSLDNLPNSQFVEKWKYGQLPDPRYPDWSKTHQVEIAIFIDENAPQNNVVTVKVYGTGRKASTGDMVDSTIKAADWDASKQTTIESLLKPYVRR